MKSWLKLFQFTLKNNSTEVFQSIRWMSSGTLKNGELMLELEGYTLRKIRKEDCGKIHHLAQELANCLKMPNAPQVDIKVLEEDGFGIRNFYEGFVADSHELDQVVGYAIYYYTYCSWKGKSLYMEDMYIRPEDRKNRIALSFFHLVSRAALMENCMRLNFSVMEQNQSAAKLFQSFGAEDLTVKEGWHYYSIPRQGIEKLAEPALVVNPTQCFQV